MRAPKVVILAVAVAVAACAGAARKTADPAARPWDAMSPAQRHAYMTETVMPEMKALFVAHDEHRYANMTCATCHGRDQGLAMPSRDLRLEPEAATSAPHGEMDRFMRDRVAPTMARLLGRPRFDCFGCHAVDE